MPDGAAQDGTGGVQQADDVTPCEAPGLAPRANPGAKEDLIGVDVPNAPQRALIHEQVLDRLLAAPRQCRQVGSRKRLRQRIRPNIAQLDERGRAPTRNNPKRRGSLYTSCTSPESRMRT